MFNLFKRKKTIQISKLDAKGKYILSFNTEFTTEEKYDFIKKFVDFMKDDTKFLLLTTYEIEIEKIKEEKKT